MMPHRPCRIRHQSMHWSQKQRPLSIADFRLLCTHVVLYSLTSSSFVSGHDRLVHASAARGIIDGLETAVVDKDTQKRRPAGLSKPAGRRLLFFSFNHLPLLASSVQLLQSHPLFWLLFLSFFRLSFRTYRNNQTLRFHPRT